MRRVGTGAVVFLACAALALPSCERATGRFVAREEVRSIQRAPVIADEVAVYEQEPDAPYEVLGPVAAWADARYEGRIDNAERLVIAELRERAGEAGADAVIIRGREVVELEPDPYVPDIAGSFEDSSRNRLRPTGARATRPVWRVRMIGDAVRVGTGGAPGADSP